MGFGAPATAMRLPNEDRGALEELWLDVADMADGESR
jgi:hypothetical protein